MGPKSISVADDAKAACTAYERVHVACSSDTNHEKSQFELVLPSVLMGQEEQLLSMRQE